MGMRKRAWEIVEKTDNRDHTGRIFSVFIFSLIILNVMCIMLESVERIGSYFTVWFRIFEFFSVAIFTVEYAVRLWSCVESEEYRSPFLGRLRFAFRFMSIIDLLAFLPFYLPLITLDLRFLRLLRIFRIFRILKIAKYTTSLNLITRVFSSKKEELFISILFMALLLVLSSCIMYACEFESQPEVYSSIPATMWWSVATLTTVGYGDVYPVTTLGRFLGGIISILGICMFALPTGILGSGFIEEFQKGKEVSVKKCPHCGKVLND